MNHWFLISKVVSFLRQKCQLQSLPFTLKCYRGIFKISKLEVKYLNDLNANNFHNFENTVFIEAQQFNFRIHFLSNSRMMLP